MGHLPNFKLSLAEFPFMSFSKLIFCFWWCFDVYRKSALAKSVLLRPLWQGMLFNPRVTSLVPEQFK
jgi:hypothetical protein